MARFSSLGFLYNINTKSVLLHHRDDKTPVNPNKWAFFGGSNEGPETPVQAFIREIKEELGVTIHEDEVIQLRDYFNEQFQRHRYVFYAKSKLAEAEFILREGQGLAWVPLEEVFSYDITEKTKNDLEFFIKFVVKDSL